MRLESMNWMQVEERLRSDDRLMLVLGACEQHGHLSLLTDVRIPLALADEVSSRTGVPVAPALPYGVSPMFADYPGTISLRTSTFLSVVEDLVRALHGQGFGRLLLVNGHGGNEAARQVLSELANDLPGLRADWYSWWRAPSVTRVAEGAGLESFHAGWIEAFDFCRVGQLPSGQKPPVPLRSVMSAAEMRAACGDGVFGGPYAVRQELMREVFEAAVADMEQLLRFE